MQRRPSVAKTHRFLFAGNACLALALAGCGKPKPEPVADSRGEGGESSQLPLDGSPNAVLPATVEAGEQSEKPNHDGGVLPSYAMLTNLEMVRYCLPYPSSYMAEDRSERWEHGRHVFVHQATGAKLDIRGWCDETPLKERYESDRARIVTEQHGAPLALNVFHSDSYVLSWKEGKRIHYGKVWASKEEKGCFVGATFDYDESERTLFDQIVSKVTRTDPTCAP